MSSPFQAPPTSLESASSGPVFTPEDAEHLRILSIFYYILAGLGFLFGSIPLFHMAIGATIVLAPQIFEQSGHQPTDPLRVFGAALFCFGAAFILIAWTLAGLQLYAGRCLAAHRKHTFCTVMAAVNCAWFPLGTVLGVFSLIVLVRPRVKARFQQACPKPFG